MFIRVLNEYYDGDVAGVEIEVIDSLTPSLIVKANSRRDPIDTPDEEVALLLAYGRAFEKIAKKLQKRADGKVRHNDNLREQRPIQKERNASRKNLMNLAATDLQGKGAKKASPSARRKSPWDTWDTWEKVY
jgi:hypothetical protein